MTGLANTPPTVECWKSSLLEWICVPQLSEDTQTWSADVSNLFFFVKVLSVKKRHALHACTHHHTRHSFTSVTAWVAEITLFILSVMAQYNERMTHFICNFHVNNRVLCFPLSVADAEFYLFCSWRVTLATVHTGQTHQGFNGNGAGSSDRGGVKYSLHTGLLDVY